MKRLVIVVGLVALLAACGSTPSSGVAVTGSDILIRIPLDLEGFTRIDANDGAQTSVEYGDEFLVELQVNDNLEPYVDVRVEGDTLHIGLQEGAYTAITFQAQMTLPALAGVTLDGGSAFRGEVNEEAFTLDLNGGSLAIIGGTARTVTIAVDGASQALLGDLTGQDVTLNVAGGSRVQIQATGVVRGTAKGASSVTVTGLPTTVEIETDGAATVNTP